MAELTVAELTQLLAALDRLGDEISEIGTWLAQKDGLEQPGLLLQDAWHSVATAGWVLERPVRDARGLRRTAPQSRADLAIQGP